MDAKDQNNEKSRCSTGILGLNELLEGGYPAGRTILLGGSCGTGKTTFAMQFIYNGIMVDDEPGIYVTLEEDPEEILEDMKKYGMNLDNAINEKKLVIIDASISRLGLEDIIPSKDMLKKKGHIIFPSELSVSNLLMEIKKSVDRIGAKRVIIDSLPAFDMFFDTKNDVRAAILRMNYNLKKMGVTTLLITEIPEGSKELSPHGVEEFIVDGVITLHSFSLGAKGGRTLVIRKMRSTKHSEDVHPIAFEPAHGIVIRSIEDE